MDEQSCLEKSGAKKNGQIGNNKCGCIWANVHRSQTLISFCNGNWNKARLSSKKLWGCMDHWKVAAEGTRGYF